MPCRCIVYGCRGNFDDGPKVSCFSFPSDEELRKKWLKVLPLKHDSINKHVKVCELHFCDSDFVKEVSGYDSKTGKTINFKLDLIRLKKDAVPSRFSEYMKIDSENFKGYLMKHLLRFENKNYPNISKQKLENEEKEDPVVQRYCLNSAAEMSDIRSKNYAKQSARVWEKDEIAALIALYELEPCLYDRKDPSYHYNNERRNAYERIQQVMINIRPNCKVPDIKNKIQYLRGQFSNEKLCKERSLSGGYCTEETFKPAMWCFRLLQFLDEHVIHQATKDRYIFDEQVQDANAEEDEGDEQCENLQKDFTADNHKDENNEEFADEGDEQFENLVEDSTADYQSDHDQNYEEYEDKDNEQCENLVADYQSHQTIVPDNSVDDNTNDLNNDKDESSKDSLEEDKQYENTFVNSENSTKRKLSDSFSTSKKNCVAENIHILNPDKDDIFGQYVAEEMKILRDKPLLYVETKQAILKILTKANFEIQDFSGA